MEIVVHGGGYVGLTGAVHFALKGVKVTIYDPDVYTVNSINSGEPRAKEYLGYINQDVKLLVDKGMLSATSNYDDVKEKPIHLLAVPTEKGDEPCMDIVKKCIVHLSNTIPHGGVIIVESTLQPGTIDELDGMVFWRFRHGEDDIHLVVAPRLDWFADSEKNVTNLPRIVGGVNENSTNKGAEILSIICKDIVKTNYKAAEWAKCGQNALYFVQIMAAHELAMKFDNVDFNEVLKLISLHWRLPTLYLGPGTSGRCVQMGAQYINNAVNEMKYYSPVIESALATDKRWREKIASILVKKFDFADSLKKEILVMGIAYRPDFSDFGYSAGLDIAEILYQHSWTTCIHDPVVPKETLAKVTDIPFSELSNKFDAVLLATGHSAYKDLPLNPGLWTKGQFVLDACGLWELYRDTFEKYGVEYIRVGQKGWLRKMI